jgi:hypothetical protein
MKLKFAVLALTIAACATTPLFAITITGTGGCTSSVNNITSTITYDGQNTNDPAGFTTYTTPFFDQGTNPGCGGDWLAQTGGQTTTVTFSVPVDYVGFVWGTPDGYNTLQLFDGNTLLGSFDGSVVTDTYMNFFADPGEQITSVTFSSGACCYETDNFSYRIAGTATPEPGTLFLLGSGLLGGLGAIRRKFLL